MRITNQMMAENAISQINMNFKRLAELQSQAGSEKRVQLPHDDPVAAGQAINIRSTISGNETYLQNIAVAHEWLSATEGVFNATGDILQKALQAAQQGASDTISSTERNSLADNVDGLIADTVTQLNSRHRDTYLLSGYQTNTLPFVTVGNPVTSASYAGDGQSRQIEIEPGQTVTINANGAALAAGILTPLINLRDALRANDTNATAASINTIQTSINSVLKITSDLGARQQRLTDVGNRLDQVQLGLKDLLSKTEDANLAEVISQLQQQDTIYKASLQSSALVGQTSLFDYLR